MDLDLCHLELRFPIKLYFLMFSEGRVESPKCSLGLQLRTLFLFFGRMAIYGQCESGF